MKEYESKEELKEEINKAYKKYIEEFTDIDESHWAYYEIMEAANSHEYKRARRKQIETWLQILNK